MSEQTSKKHGTILAASVVVTLIAAVSLIFGSVAGLGAADKWSRVAESADGSTIAYDMRGHDHGRKSPVLVFIHGWTCNRGFWTPQIEHFSKTYEVISLDLAGHGSSDSKRDDYTMGAFGQDVAAVVEQSGAESVVLIGHSMGGPVAIEAANILKEKVAGIVAVDIFFISLGLPESAREVDEFIEPFENDFESESEKFVRSMFLPEADPDLVASIAKTMSGADKGMAISALRNVLRWQMENTPSALERHARKLRNINAIYDGNTASQESVVTIPDVGHFIAQVKPDAFNAALEGILPE